ncbi:hypothetical protein PspLS_07905, partial [Pyricularia sp. CBS 133598]
LEHKLYFRNSPKLPKAVSCILNFLGRSSRGAGAAITPANGKHQHAYLPRLNATLCTQWPGFGYPRQLDFMGIVHSIKSAGVQTAIGSRRVTLYKPFIPIFLLTHGTNVPKLHCATTSQHSLRSWSHHDPQRPASHGCAFFTQQRATPQGCLPVPSLLVKY